MWLQAGHRDAQTETQEIVVGWPVYAYGLRVAGYKPISLDPLEEAVLRLANCRMQDLAEIAGWLSLPAIMVEAAVAALVDQGLLAANRQLTTQGFDFLKGVDSSARLLEYKVGFLLRDRVYGEWFPYFLEAPLTYVQGERDYPDSVTVAPIGSVGRSVTIAEARAATDLIKRELEFLQQQRSQEEGGDYIPTLADREQIALFDWVELVDGEPEELIVPVTVQVNEHVRGGLVTRCPFSGLHRERYWEWLSDLPDGLPDPVRELKREGGFSRGVTMLDALQSERRRELEAEVSQRLDEFLPVPFRPELAYLRDRMRQLEMARMRAAGGDEVAARAIPVQLREMVEAVLRHLCKGIRMTRPAERFFGVAAGPMRRGPDRVSQLFGSHLARVGIDLDHIPQTVLKAAAELMDKFGVEVTECRGTRDLIALLLMQTIAENMAPAEFPRPHDGALRLRIAQATDHELFAEILRIQQVGNIFAHPDRRNQNPPSAEELEDWLFAVCRVLNALAAETLEGSAVVG